MRKSAPCDENVTSRGVDLWLIISFRVQNRPNSDRRRHADDTVHTLDLITGGRRLRDYYRRRSQAVVDDAARGQTAAARGGSRREHSSI